MINIHQLIAGAGAGDAITNYAMEIQNIFKRKGILSHIYCPFEHTSSEYKTNGSVKNQSDLLNEIKADDILIYHYSIGSSSSKIYQQANCKKALCYHNVTPQKYFQNLSEKQSEALKLGRQNLSEQIPYSQVAFADSDYNKLELDQIGFKNTETIPLAYPTDYLKASPTVNIINRFNNGFLNFLFVGRIAPNKRFEDIIKTFAIYHKTINDKSQLILVGSYAGNEKYFAYLKTLTNDLNISTKVRFTGHVSNSDLVAYYKVADIFLCLSEHEGFGLPIIESMLFDVIVFALDKAAVSETLGNSGILLKKMDHIKTAELINQISKNSNLKQQIIQKQHERANCFTLRALKKNLSQLLNKYFDFND